MRFSTALIGLIGLVLAGAAGGADKQPGHEAADEQINQLLEIYDANSGDIDNLYTLYTDFDKALRETLISNMHPDTLPGYGSGQQLVYEFSDYQCGYCRLVYPTLTKAADAGKVRVVLIELPVLGNLSKMAAKYALAAGAQSKFTPFHNYLMRHKGRLNEDTLAAAVTAAALDDTLLHDFLNSTAADRQLERNYKLAAIVGVNATPSFIINGKIYHGALSQKDFNDLLE